MLVPVATILFSVRAANGRVARQMDTTEDPGFLESDPALATTSSSYDYWWPYPPTGQTPTPSPTMGMTSVDAAVSTTLTSVEDMDPLNTDSLSVSITSSSSISFDPSTTYYSSDSSASIITLVSPSNSSSTAFPLRTDPKTSTVSVSTKTMMYLIPVFVVLGVILGSVCAWIAWGCYTRKPRVREYVDAKGNLVNADGNPGFGEKRENRRRRVSELEIGPAYSAPSPEEDPYYTAAFGSDDEHRHLALPSTYSQRFPSKARSSSISKGVSPTSTGFTRTRRVSSSSDTLTRQTTSKTAKTDYSLSVYSQMDYDEDEDDFVNRLLDKEDVMDEEIPGNRRGRIVSRRRPKHARNESDMVLEDGLTSPKFRIIEESPLPTPATRLDSKNGSNSDSAALWSSLWTGSNPEKTDAYTALPVRSPVKKKSSRQPRSHAVGSHPRLAQSPPRVSSPLLDEELCFTPRMSGKDRF
ncbi:hypothetical protein C8J56DRAFT_180766 [Mycena floridula]|nr:hypothetical protein C8J56DRAFT_180766 [Mycena floridula]